MKLTFWGVRGVAPAPGPATVRYGGNTACVEVRSTSGALTILDAGTGLIPLGRMLTNERLDATLLLSHTHWDHIHGFPFFAPIFLPQNRLTIFGPGRSSEALEGILAGQLAGHFSPIYALKNLSAQIVVRVVDATPFEAGGLRIQAVELPHGKTSALAFRLQENGSVCAYLPDAGYRTEPSEAAVECCHRADILIHDATYSPEDFEKYSRRGFASVEHAVAMAMRAEVKRLVLFHYSEEYSDGFLDALGERARLLLDQAGGKSIELVAAREGSTIEVPAAITGR